MVLVGNNDDVKKPGLIRNLFDSLEIDIQKKMSFCL